MKTKAKAATTVFTRDKIDPNTWHGPIEGYGNVSFTVTGTYGPDHQPIVNIYNTYHRVAIEWATGKVLKSF